MDSAKNESQPLPYKAKEEARLQTAKLVTLLGLLSKLASSMCVAALLTRTRVIS